MVNVIRSQFSAVPADSGKRALVVKDEGGRFDGGRRVSYEVGGPTFYWSETSIQADFASTVALAVKWAIDRDVATVYICQ